MKKEWYETFTTTVIEPITQRLVISLQLLRCENLVACKWAREEVNGINENSIASQGTQQYQQYQQHQHFDEVRRLLILLRGAIDNITVSCLSSGINDSCEWDDVQNSIKTRTTMTIATQQHRDDDIIRMANGTASILRDILVQRRQIYTANKNDKVSIEVMLHQSRYNACMEEAALTLTSLWRMIVPLVAQDGVLQRRPATANDSNSAAAANYGGNGYSNNNDERVIVTIAEEFVLPSLIACAVALSSFDVVPVTITSHDASSSSSSSSSSADNNDDISNQALDTGEDCIMALFTCIQYFFIPIQCDNKYNSKNNSSDDDCIVDGNDYEFDDNEKVFLMQQIAKEVGSAMKGALVARLVECCLTVLTPNQVDDTIARSHTSSSSSSLLGKKSNHSASLQLEALKTLHTLLLGIPITELWQSILPGCFAGLYRYALSRLRYSSSTSSTAYNRATVLSVRVLALLLERTLSCRDNELTTPLLSNNQDDITTSLMSAVASHRQQRPKDEQHQQHQQQQEESFDEKKEGGEEMQMRQFQTAVNGRLIGPISVLLTMLPHSVTASNGRYQRTSMELLKSGVHLCNAILTRKVRTFWTESNRKTLEKKSLEYCFMMLNIGDDNVMDGSINNDELTSYASKIMNSYKSYYLLDSGNSDGMAQTSSRWKAHLSSTIVPTILELIETLPTFATSGREMHVQHHLRLVSGYLMLSLRGSGGNNNDDHSIFDWCQIKKWNSDIGSALSCAEAVDIVTRSFSVLFAPDIDTITCSPIIEIFSSSSSSDPNIIVPIHQQDSSSSSTYYRFLHLRDESTVSIARHTVQLFALVLGVKRCAYVIDSCVAELFESCSRSISASSPSMSSRNSTSCGSDQDYYFINDRLDQRLKWSGQYIFITELVKGIRKVRSSSSSEQLSKSTLHIFSTLASSVLPVLVSEPLWILPTVLDVNQADANFGNTQSDKTFTAIRESDRSVTIMNSNAILISVVLGFIRQVTLLLGTSMTLHLPTVLFPILERSSSLGNHPSVQRTSITTLQEITLVLGYNDITSLIATNFDYLVDIISLKLRTCARDHVSMERSLVGVIDVILRSAVYHDGSTGDSGSAMTSDNQVSLAGHMLNCILKHMDQQSCITNLSILDITRVFRSMITFMDSSIATKHNSLVIDTTMDALEDEDYWLRRLDIELTIDTAGYEYANDDEYNNDDQMNNAIEESPEVSPVNNSRLSSQNDKEKDFVHEIASINTILARCCYLLCYSDIQIQVLCCETIMAGFHSLGMVGTIRRQLYGEFAVSNPLLPAIAEFWPSILARLRSASMSLTSVTRLSRSDLSIRHVMGSTDQGLQRHHQEVASHNPSSAATSTKANTRAGLQVLLSKLLHIVAEICNSSDDFFVDRFVNDAYPLIATLMSNILLPQHRNDSIGPPDQLSSHVSQRQYLLLSVIHCLTSAYKSGCRRGLINLISPIGDMLFPLLAFDDNGPVCDGAMTAIKAMMNVDNGDSLWRGLQLLSRRPFPCHPIPTTTASCVLPLSRTSTTYRPATSLAKKDDDVVTTTSPSLALRNRKGDDVLSKNACELLDYMKCLPEQEII